MRDLSLFSQENGQLTPVVPQAPGGGFNPEFNNMFAQNLGFGPPPPGAQPMPPMQQQQAYPQQPPQPNHNVGAGQFDLGGGHQLRVKINGQTPENYVKNRVSSMVWGWIIGLIVLALIVLGGIGLGIYIYFQAKDGGSSPVAAQKQAQAAAWDGKTPLTCSGVDAIAVSNVTATAGVVASGNCQVTLANVSITAPIAIEASANAKVTMTGGSITASTNSVVASANATVTLTGTKVTGKSKKNGNAKITGAP
ncbi:MAG: hypothetical protein KF837_24030 [Labilithrix sp.]|nr:hypothetical protein [Labilithrix sp.]